MNVDSWQTLHRIEMQGARRELQARATDAWGDMVRDLMPWSVIVNAATYDTRELAKRYRARRGRPSLAPELTVPPVTREMNKVRINWFLEGARHQLGRPVEGFGACEYGGAGDREHWHGLLALHGGLQEGDITALSGFWRGMKGNGFIKLEVPKSMDWFAQYVAKHTVKQLGDMVMSVGCGRCTFLD